MAINRKLNIHFITENEETYFKVSELLNSLNGYSVSTHWSRDFEAATSIDNTKFDICLYDDSLTSADAFKFLQYKSKNSILTPTIVISKGSSRNRDIRLLREGASDYLIEDKIRSGYLYRAIVYSLERSTRVEEEVKTQHALMREQKINSLGKLAANISIKLNKNLEILNDYIDNIPELSNKEDVNVRIDKCKKVIKESRAYINNLLAFSPTEIEMIPAYNLKDLILESTEFFNQATKRKVNILSSISSEDNILVDLNPSEIKQAIANIILNAQEAMPNGGAVKVKLEIVPQKDLPSKLKNTKRKYAKIQIKDNGTGIKPEDLNRLFEPTFTTKNTQGLGLGLTQVFKVITAHNGWVSAQSEINKGTTFTIYLPISDSIHKEQKDKTKRAMVMVIEPDFAQTQICKLYFDAASLDSRIFSDPSSASKWYKKNNNKISLIMLNSFSKEDLEEMVLEFNSIDPNVKIIFSGHLESKVIEELNQKGLVKVFPPENRYLATISWVGELGI